MHSPLFAREILKAKPVAGKSNYRKLLLENNWVKEIYTKPYREKLSEFDRNGINGISTQGQGRHLKFSWTGPKDWHSLS